LEEEVERMNYKYQDNKFSGFSSLKGCREKQLE